MKKRLAMLAALIVAVSLLFPGCSGKDKEGRWVLIGAYDSDSLYYDKDTLKRLPEGVIQVTIMTKLSRESVNARINQRKILNMPVEGYDKSSYDLSLVELNCKRGMFKQMTISEYDDKGNKLSDYAAEINIRISPGSRGEIISEKVCQE